MYCHRPPNVVNVNASDILGKRLSVPFGTLSVDDSAINSKVDRKRAELGVFLVGGVQNIYENAKWIINPYRTSCNTFNSWRIRTKPQNSSAVEL